jgi:hypothetical protein
MGILLGPLEKFWQPQCMPLTELMQCVDKKKRENLDALGTLSLYIDVSTLLMMKF